MIQLVPVDEWQEQQRQGALHAFLTPDDSKIVLMAAGNDWDQRIIATHLDTLTSGWEHVMIDGRETGAVTIPCTWGNVVQLGFTFASLTGISLVHHGRLRDWIEAEEARRRAELPELEPSWPPWLSPRDYQIEAARQIARAGRFFLLDDMGLGKTVTTLLGIEQRRRMGISVFPMVVLVPSWEVADAWDAEIRKWMPGWGDPVMYAGTDRLRLLRHPGARVLLTTYATARLDAKDASAPLTKFAAPCVVVDEASLIQNSKARQAEAAERITRSASTVIELSGTLITRNVAGAFHPLKVADRKTWASKERFTAKFCLSRPSDFQSEITGLNPLAETEFRACLLGQMTRRAKADVLKELPPKTYMVLRPEIPPEWRQAYDQMREDMLAELPGNDEELEVMDTLSQLTRLSQLASSAADVRYEEVEDKRTGLWVKKAIVTLRPPSWKAEVLMTMLAGATQPVAVFTASRQLARIVGEHYLRPAGLRYDYIIGQGDGVTRGTRKQAMLDFQAGKLDVIVCTASAGGLGITLTRAPDAVMLQRPWPLDHALQPEDRIHRLGQLADKVTITDVVARDTVDERVRELLREKAGQLSQFVKDPRIVRELLGGKR